MSGGLINSSCYFKCIKRGRCRQLWPSRCSAISSGHLAVPGASHCSLGKRHTTSPPGEAHRDPAQLWSTLLLCQQETRSPLARNAKRQEQKSWQCARPPADGPTGSSAQKPAPGWVGPGQLHFMCRWGYEAHASPQARIAPHIREFQQSLQPSLTSREPAASPQGLAVATPTGKDGKLQLPLLPPFMRFPKGENHK